MSVLDMLTPVETVLHYVEVLESTLEALDDSLDLRIEPVEAISTYGYGDCRVSQVVVYWSPLKATLTRAELHTYASLLALALDCALVELRIIPEGLGGIGDPKQIEHLLGPRPVFSRLDESLEMIKTVHSEGLAQEAREAGRKDVGNV